jgi:hypothetical protein
MAARRYPRAMNPRQLALAFLSVAALASACSAPSGQLVPMPSQDVELSRPELCRIYVARSSQPMGALREMRVFDGDTEIGSVDGGEYLCWERTPGRIVVRALYEGPALDRGEQEEMFDLQAEAGGVYYFTVELAKTSDMTTGGEKRGSPQLVALSRERGRELLAGSSPVDD